MAATLSDRSTDSAGRSDSTEPEVSPRPSPSQWACRGGSGEATGAVITSWGITGFKELGYTVSQWLGKGSWGRGVRTADGTEVAINTRACLSQNERLRVRREHELLCRLDHRSILRPEALYETRYDLWICYEWCGGGSVSQAIQARGPFSVSLCYTLSAQLLEGLAYIHERRIVHGKIRASVLFLTADGKSLKIADFSQARKADEVEEAATGAPMASDEGEEEDEDENREETKKRHWAAPELLRGAHCDENTDIWACGICIHFFAKGRPPMREEDGSVSEKDAGLFRESPDKGCAAEAAVLSRIAKACLAWEPVDRQSAMSMMDTTRD